MKFSSWNVSNKYSEPKVDCAVIHDRLKVPEDELQFKAKIKIEAATHFQFNIDALNGDKKENVEDQN